MELHFLQVKHGTLITEQSFGDRRGLLIFQKLTTSYEWWCDGDI